MRSDWEGSFASSDDRGDLAHLTQAAAGVVGAEGLDVVALSPASIGSAHQTIAAISRSRRPVPLLRKCAAEIRILQAVTGSKSNQAERGESGYQRGEDE